MTKRNVTSPALGDNLTSDIRAAALADEPAAPTLHRYEDGEELRDATGEELAESVEAARHDGGAGVIRVDGVRCYVADPCPVTLSSGGAS